MPLTLEERQLAGDFNSLEAAARAIALVLGRSYDDLPYRDQPIAGETTKQHYIEAAAAAFRVLLGDK